VVREAPDNGTATWQLLRAWTRIALSDQPAVVGIRTALAKPAPLIAHERRVAVVAQHLHAAGLDQIEVVEAAAARHSGTAELVVVRDRLWTRLASVGDHHEGEARVEVRTVALDDVDGPPPTIVKIDVEGAELDVLSASGYRISMLGHSDAKVDDGVANFVARWQGSAA